MSQIKGRGNGLVTHSCVTSECKFSRTCFSWLQNEFTKSTAIFSISLPIYLNITFNCWNTAATLLYTLNCFQGSEWVIAPLDTLLCFVQSDICKNSWLQMPFSLIERMMYLLHFTILFPCWSTRGHANKLLKHYILGKCTSRREITNSIKHTVFRKAVLSYDIHFH